ncbi:hypothetical protein ONZ45_g4300 [Pleurotus djamor]|nr:hypothetical protein ONZ45_g4300 [Pleurotus djamor]
MPSQGTLTTDEKNKVRSAVDSPDSNLLLVAALARIYYAHPTPNSWSYAGLQGALAFTLDKMKNVFVLKLVELDGTRGVVWEHELYDGFEYFQDRPYFHSFGGDDCMIGLVFADESEAKVFFKKVSKRKSPSATKNKSKEKAQKKATKGGKINKSMISGPTAGSFVHVGHIGFDSDAGFTSRGVDQSWSTILSDSQNRRGVGNDIIQEYAQQSPRRSKPPPPPAPRRGGHAHHGSNSSGHKVPPPPPAPRVSMPPPAPLLNFYMCHC